MVVRSLLLLITALALTTGCPAGSGYEGPDEEVTDPTWDDDVQPILKGYCDGCHEGDNAVNSGGHNWLDSFADVQVAPTFNECSEYSTRAECVPYLILNEVMPFGSPCPPGEEDCITQAQFDTVQNWVDAGTPEN